MVTKMIRSMTAYAEHEVKDKWGRTVWEIRSLNQRYLEIYIRLPEPFRNIESVIRERIRCRLSRGKIEVNLHFNPEVNLQNSVLLNENLALKLIQIVNWIKRHSNAQKINPMDIIRWPGVILSTEENFDFIVTRLTDSFNQAIEDLITTREREGLVLQLLIEKKLEHMFAEVMKIRAHMPSVLIWQHDRLISRLNEAQLTQLDNNRIEQELVMLSQRIDVSEELDRIENHITETYNVLKRKEAVGRRLDFIMQEFNREANTLGSKSINAEITTSAIELKVIIEQMREQIQNVE